MDVLRHVDDVTRLVKWVMMHAPESGYALANQDHSLFSAVLDILETQRTEIDCLQHSLVALTSKEFKKPKRIHVGLEIDDNLPPVGPENQ